MDANHVSALSGDVTGIPLKYRRPNRSRLWSGSKIPHPKISQTISTLGDSTTGSTRPTTVGIQKEIRLIRQNKLL
jgi:hypothetical protein